LNALSRSGDNQLRNLTKWQQETIATLLENHQSVSNVLANHAIDAYKFSQHNEHVIRDESEKILDAVLQLRITPPSLAESSKPFETSPCVPAIPEGERKGHFNSVVLESLNFDIIADRHEEICETYKNTYDWIFREPSPSKERPWADFSRWIQNGMGIYWINGKAGSGKSTLMKYISDDPQTRQLLPSGDLPWIIVSFFFWNAGEQLQKSHEGLLRTLLYQALSKHPAGIPTVFPDLWRAFNTLPAGYQMTWEPRSSMRDGNYSLSALKRAFSRLLHEVASARFCFIVDGLDEFDGDHDEIVGVFQAAASSQTVKICVSSRPLLVFEDAFKEFPKLRLQDLTQNDIFQYVNGCLADSLKWKNLAQQDPKESRQLIEDIVQKASGVFLWVTLVVKSLLVGLRNHDKLSTLKKRLSFLPTGLKQLYIHMLERLEPIYLQEAYCIFQIVLHAQAPLSVLELSYATDEDPGLAMSAAISPLSPLEHASRISSMEARLKSCCVGLLEVNESKVEFIHRSAKDFLEEPAVWKILDSKFDCGFDANISLMKASLIRLKKLSIEQASPANEATEVGNGSSTEVKRRVEQYQGFEGSRPAPDSVDFREFWKLVHSTLKYACIVEESTSCAPIQLLDELDYTATHHWLSIIESISFKECHRYRYTSPHLTAADHWSDSDPRDYQRSYPWKDNFLALTIKYGLARYVAEKVYQNPRASLLKAGRPLLAYATEPLQGPAKPELVRLLLQAGARPNETANGSSPWGDFLSFMCRKIMPGDLNNIHSLYEICATYLEFSADPLRTCKLYSNISKNVWVVRQPGASEVIAKIFRKWDPDKEMILQALLRGKRGQLTPKVMTRSIPEYQFSCTKLSPRASKTIHITSRRSEPIEIQFWTPNDGNSS
jgi:hypothetical protein